MESISFKFVYIFVSFNFLEKERINEYEQSNQKELCKGEISYFHIFVQDVNNLFYLIIDFIFFS